MCAVKELKKEKPPTHGWDYEKMIELFEFDDEDLYTYTPTQTQEPPTPSVEELSPTSSKSPTTDITDESSTEQEEDAPPLLPKLPVDLTRRQDLSLQLDLPEVIRATEPHLEHGNRRRRKNAPSNYAIYSKTGEKWRRRWKKENELRNHQTLAAA